MADTSAYDALAALEVDDVEGISTLLDSGVNVFTFTPTEPGTIRYSCAMGMYTGVIHVVPAPAA